MRAGLARSQGRGGRPQSCEYRGGAQLAARAHVDVRFLAGDLLGLKLTPESFDAVIGIYALHHVDIAAFAPALAALLTQDGRAAFVETMAANPLLRLARRHLVGHLGIPRLGSPDEHPFTDDSTWR